MAKRQTRDWSQLPLDLLQDVAGRLTAISDHARIRCVCVTWRSASKSIAGAADFPPQLPWLLLPADVQETGGRRRRRFFSLTENRVYALHLPESRETRTSKIFPSSRGWIITPQDIETLALLNLLTRSSVLLPPLPLTENLRRNMGAYVLRKVKHFASSNLVAVDFPHGHDIFLCRPGESSWKRIDMSPSYPSDFTCHNGRFFVTNRSHQISVFDLDTLQKVEEIPMVRGAGVEEILLVRGAVGFNYLVESPTGELLLVRRRSEYECKRFDLFQLEVSGEQVKWIEVTDIGDNVLFVDGLQAIAFAVANDSNGWRKNCIYFVEDSLYSDSKALMLFDIGKGWIERPLLFSYTSRGFWGKAMWVIPTLH